MKVKIIQEGWYRVKIVEVTTKPSKVREGINIITVKMEMPRGSFVYKYIAWDLPSLAIPLLKTCRVRLFKHKETYVDLKKLVERELEVFVKPEAYKGHESYRVQEVRKLEKRGGKIK